MTIDRAILIVSDDETLWELLNYMVQKAGFKTERAGTAREGVSKARMLRPELILLGLKAHGSYETLRELQTDDAVDIPIVLLPDRHLDQATLELVKQETNVKAVIQAPIDAQALTALLAIILNARAPGKKRTP